MDSQQPMSIPEAEQHQTGMEVQQEGFLEEGWESQGQVQRMPLMHICLEQRPDWEHWLAEHR